MTDPLRNRIQAGPAMLVLACLLAAAMPSHAAWYQVEVVIFEAVTPDADGEAWLENAGRPDTAYSTELVTAAADPPPVADGGLIPYLALDSSWYRLDGVFRSLRTTREYRPVLHVAWQQPGDGPIADRAVHLMQPRDPTALPSTDIAGPYVALDAILDGTVQVRVGRFLHVAVDMAYFPNGAAAAPAPGTAVAVPASMRMQTRRKVLLNDLNYFDHPLFGMLVQVSRLQEKPEKP